LSGISVIGKAAEEGAFEEQLVLPGRHERQSVVMIEGNGGDESVYTSPID
jgi:hypothetical protein